MGLQPSRLLHSGLVLRGPRQSPLMTTPKPMRTLTPELAAPLELECDLASACLESLSVEGLVPTLEQSVDDQ